MNHGQSTYTVTVTNNSNGVSVDYETETPMTLLVPEVAAEVIKDLVNTVRSYPRARVEGFVSVMGLGWPRTDPPVLKFYTFLYTSSIYLRYF